MEWMPNILMRVSPRALLHAFQPHFDTFSFRLLSFFPPSNGGCGNKFYNKIYYVYFAPACLPPGSWLLFSRSLACNLIRYPRDFFICQFLVRLLLLLWGLALSQRIWVQCKNHLLNVYPRRAYGLQVLQESQLGSGIYISVIYLTRTKHFEDAER